MRKWLGLGSYPFATRAVVLWRAIDILVCDRILGERVPRTFRGVVSTMDEKRRNRIMEELKPILPQILKLWIPRFIKRPISRKRFVDAFRRAVAPEPSPLFLKRDAEYEAADPGSVIYRAVANIRREIDAAADSPMIAQDLAGFVVLTLREEFFEAMKLAFDDRLPDMAYFDRQKDLTARRQSAVDTPGPSF